MTVNRDALATTIEIVGDVGHTDRNAITDAVRDALAAPAAPELVLDLRDVASLDGEALQLAVIGPATRAHDAGIRTHVMANDDVRDKIRRVGLSHLL